MKRLLLINLGYRCKIVLPIECLGMLDSLLVVKEVNNAYVEEKSEYPMEISIINSDQVSEAAMEKAYEAEAKKFERYWLDQSKENTRLKEELKKLSGSNGTAAPTPSADFL